MLRFSTRFLCCLLLAICLQQVSVVPVAAGEKEERVQLLQQKMDKLQELLVKLEEKKLRQQPPTEIPWQAILALGEERLAYDQYAYLLAPQMQATELDSSLQQLHYLASQDKMEERGTLFVVPALPLDAGEKMSVKSYNRDLAGILLKQLGMPTALEGGILVSPSPVAKLKDEREPLLFVDLAGCDQILRSRIFGTLQTTRMFNEDGSIHQYLWNLLESASPQTFSVYVQDGLLWLSRVEE